MVEKAKEPETEKEDPPVGDDLEKRIAQVVKAMLEEQAPAAPKEEGRPSGGGSRRDIEAIAHEQARKAVREAQDQSELEKLRAEKAAAAAKPDEPQTPTQYRKLTRWMWGEPK